MSTWFSRLLAPTKLIWVQPRHKHGLKRYGAWLCISETMIDVISWGSYVNIVFSGHFVPKPP